MKIFRLEVGFDGKCFVVADLSGNQQHRSNDLEVVVAGESNEQMQEQPLAVLKNLRPVMI